ncbi:exodeoxyribonuclease VII large subunit [Clostridium sp. YIM B02515]|uniref:Exodeoxyribonuclease 7 large subunit n=1 Tax=Clostridium rhizosphaerae TaxID=2803861 RepID=A0ABS1TEV1_9CLOT|nr:exodeoxyribonuclease VII large subunit [Clostridium rhizosphaerae]MBL4937906.1 exodeoxyribonuclease VII large subunit [Clostridium rhizosphaerae]
MYIKTLSVSALNNYIKKTLDADFILNNLSIKGEISNLKLHSSGHMYFSLKDEGSKINCIMFKTYASSLKFLPKDGESVVVKGKVSVYEKDGAYQLYCQEITQEGLGELYIAFQKLKEKLEKQGLFDEKRKRPLPKYPRRIGVITSPTGAAVRDIINVSTRRYKGVNMLIYPALVQGYNASEDIIRGIQTLNQIEDIDVIILARGGGSLEELWAFNNEELAYEVYNSKKPIITGVGHETDFTIVDFVSDRRAPTPSAAAEMAVPNREELLRGINTYESALNTSISNTLKDYNNKIESLRKTLYLNSPANFIVNQYNYIDRLQDTLNYKMKLILQNKKENLGKLNSLLDAHNPLKVLNKGYAMIQDSDGKIISEKKDLKENKEFLITLKDGKLKACMNSITEI